ncbi:proline dehydrogenase family protein [Candidatus Methanoperedens nitratireducens]|uniref:proline dehydrogenase n=1 Tax=Candidatus Methanoperedens nitratireducens TaxID=1392998 RepID=A0A284VS59_9EURY|nr:proline dehydrogenase family protein [Candidatus Methanoperedens nitroreducens]SNQ62120.1 Proline dehydrogenase [Candidatus Methanoperedens nitroreducens]
MSFLTRFARQWIAGETLDDAIAQAKKKNNAGIRAIINFLGEHVKDEAEADNNVEENLRILRAIEESKTKASLSIKPTQLGLDIDKNLCLSKVEKIVSTASSKNIFVWIDMENSPYAQGTVDIYLEIIKKHKNAGIAIQANLKRSESDIARIAASMGIIRLVKGAYSEKMEIAYTSRSDITRNFSKLMAYLFYKSPFFAIATHDDRLINEAIEANKTHQKRLEFQMLMGVRDELKRKLVREGFAVVDYIPYGKNWFPYTTRRVRERKRNILLILRSVFDI